MISARSQLIHPRPAHRVGPLRQSYARPAPQGVRNKVPLRLAHAASDRLEEGPQDWQTRVGWPGRFVKVPAPIPVDLAQPHHLGAGHFGTVTRMREVATGREVAIKKFESRPSDLDRASRLAGNELEVVQGVRCHHCILPEEMTIDRARHEAFLVSPFVAGVTLAKAFELTEAVAKQVLVDMLKALADLEAQGIAHNDVHGNNIMVHEGSGYLIDFGVACKSNEDFVRRRDMSMLRDTMRDFWPWPMTLECRNFFAWFQRRIAAEDTTQIAQDALKHPFIAPYEPS